MAQITGKSTIGNKLSLLWEELFRKKIERLNNAMAPIRTMGFLGQRINPKRQSRNKTMKALGIKTGKAYRRYEKQVRRENREEEERLKRAA
jgi:hypothetical protein